jgi:WD40 repeat protein
VGARARVIGTEPSPITLLRGLADGRTFVTGTNAGTVTVYRNEDRPEVILKAAGPIRHLALSPQRTNGELAVAVASEDGHVHLRTMPEGASSPPWQTVAVPARSVAFSPDGRLLAITCTDGAVWYYSFASGCWTVTWPHQTDVFSGRFSPDGRYFVSSDGSGTVVLHDVVRLRAHGPSAREYKEMDR